MKSIATQAVITGIRSRADRSVGLSISTPELKPEEKTLFFELQNINVDLVITPIDEKNAPQVKIDKELNSKTQSQIIRNTLYRLWEQNSEGMDYEEYYRNKTEKYIQSLKARFEDR